MAVTPTAGRRRQPVASVAPVAPAEPGAGRELRDAETGPSVVASAAMVPLENLGWDRPQSAAAWQRELWRLLDIVGELKAAANWVASPVSRGELRMGDGGGGGGIGGGGGEPRGR